MATESHGPARHRSRKRSQTTKASPTTIWTRPTPSGPASPSSAAPDLDILTFTLAEPSRASIRLTTSSRISYQLYDGRGEPYRLPNGNTVNGTTPSGGPTVTRIPCESLPAGTYYVHLYAAGTGSHGESYEVLLELGDDGVDYESEPNDDMDQADTIRPGVPFIGSPRPGHTDIHPGRALEGQHPPDNVLAHLLPAVRRARRALPPAQRQHRQRDDPVRGPDRHSDSVREPPSGNVLRAPLRGRNRIARRKLRGAFGAG